MRILTCSRFFPKGHIRAGQPTHFVEQIWKGFYKDGTCPDTVDQWIKAYTIHIPDISSYNNAGIKLTSIRAGNRWKAGDMASLRVWTDKPYRSKQIEFAQVEVKSTQDFEIKQKKKELIWSIDGDDQELFAVGSTGLEVIARNDGLSIEDFMSWFSIHPKSKGMEFSGQVITWHDNLKY